MESHVELVWRHIPLSSLVNRLSHSKPRHAPVTVFHPGPSQSLAILPLEGFSSQCFIQRKLTCCQQYWWLPGRFVSNRDSLIQFCFSLPMFCYRYVGYSGFIQLTSSIISSPLSEIPVSFPLPQDPTQVNICLRQYKIFSSCRLLNLSVKFL